MQLGSTSVTISWSSNCNGFGEVLYGFTGAQLNGLVQDKSFAQSHTVVLGGLSQGRTYFCFAATLNAVGLITAQSAIFSFTTLTDTPTATPTSTLSATPTDTSTDSPTATSTNSPTDTPTSTWTATASFTPTPSSTPTVCSIATGPTVQMGSTSVTISWSSNCAGFGVVHYGLTATQLSGLVQDKSFVQNHMAVLAGLSQGRTYFYFAATLNSAGLITAQSVTLSFTTLVNTPVPTASFTPTATTTDSPTQVPVPPTDTPTPSPANTVVPGDTPTSSPTDMIVPPADTPSPTPGNSSVSMGVSAAL